MKNFIYISLGIVLLSSCAAKKDLAALQEEHKMLKDDLRITTQDYSDCLNREKNANADIDKLESDVDYLKSVNYQLLENAGELATLSAKEAENLEKSLESLKEKDMQIRRMQDALTKKDSVTLALVTSLKGSLGSLDDEDIEVNVEKGVVYISISDKLLFKSGSYVVNEKAKLVLEKVATVVNDKPDMEFMVEGHTDNVPISKSGILDNWDLSVKRATAIVRVLQDEFDVNPANMTAAGRGEYAPIASNETTEGKAANRRTRIVVLPKIDQFYQMIEEGMENAE